MDTALSEPRDKIKPVAGAAKQAVLDTYVAASASQPQAVNLAAAPAAVLATPAADVSAGGSEPVPLLNTLGSVAGGMRLRLIGQSFSPDDEITVCGKPCQCVQVSKNGVTGQHVRS